MLKGITGIPGNVKAGNPPLMRQARCGPHSTACTCHHDDALSHNAVATPPLVWPSQTNADKALRGVASALSLSALKPKPEAQSHARGNPAFKAKRRGTVHLSPDNNWYAGSRPRTSLND